MRVCIYTCIGSQARWAILQFPSFSFTSSGNHTRVHCTYIYIYIYTREWSRVLACIVSIYTVFGARLLSAGAFAHPPNVPTLFGSSVFSVFRPCLFLLFHLCVYRRKWKYDFPFLIQFIFFLFSSSCVRMWFVFAPPLFRSLFFLSSFCGDEITRLGKWYNSSWLFWNSLIIMMMIISGLSNCCQ